MSLIDFVASRRALAGFLLAVLPAGSALAATRVLRGTVAYRERIALPPKAIVEVKLLDVSRADAPAHVIAETRVSGRRIPAHWTLRFDSREIQPRHSYALQARILLGEQLLFINTQRHAVFTGGRDDTAIWVQRVVSRDQADGTPASLVGNWRLLSLGGSEVPASITTTLELTADGKVSGRGGCNRFAGSATVRGTTIRFSRMASTMMACLPEMMDQERRFLDALAKVRRWERQRGTGQLALLDGSSRTLMVLAAA